MKKKLIVHIALCSIHFLHGAHGSQQEKINKHEIEIPRNSYLKIHIYSCSDDQIELIDSSSKKVKIQSSGKFSVERTLTEPEGAMEIISDVRDTAIIRPKDDTSKIEVCLPAALCFCRINRNLTSPRDRKQ